MNFDQMAGLIFLTAMAIIAAGVIAWSITMLFCALGGCERGLPPRLPLPPQRGDDAER